MILGADNSLKIKGMGGKDKVRYEAGGAQRA